MKLKHFITATVVSAIACIGLLILWSYIPYYPYVTNVVDKIAKSIVFFILLAHNIITTEYFTGKMNIPKDNMKLKILFSLSITMLTIMAITVLIGLVFINTYDDNISILTGGMILYYGIPIEAIILIILVTAFHIIRKKHKNKDE
ncbi:MAG: hypothetical protein K2K91_10630 [Ruminococcus sp.]|nr:hypothetical protein [Ruminococcus sp.]MDE7097918.1 hypothetical protein [Ruminococcus sp.]